MSTFQFVTKKGKDISSIFDDLAQLRITVFSAYPYLYDGTIEYEKEYLSTYSRAERSFLFGVYSEGRMVGATTCIPLKDETPEVRAPIESAKLDIDRIFYFGESILLPEFRGKGLGHRFFDEREAHVRQFGTYNKTCFLAIERDANHSARPPDYHSNEKFWKKRGYVIQPSLQAKMEWSDIDQRQASVKTLIFWMKDI